MNIGQKTAIDYYFKQGYTIIPVMDNPDYWYKDIDLLIKKDDIITSVQCKYDNYISNTRKIFAEEYTNLQQKHDGWIKFVESDIIWYLDSVKMIAYVFKTADLKDYIANHPNLDKKQAKDFDRYGRLRKTSQGIMVPLEDFGKEYKITAIPV